MVSWRRSAAAMRAAAASAASAATTAAYIDACRSRSAPCSRSSARRRCHACRRSPIRPSARISADVGVRVTNATTPDRETI